MEAVGYDMYLKILADAIEENRENAGGETDSEKTYTPQKDCLIDIQIDAHIPESYIYSVPHRLSMYRRIADVRTNEDAMDVTDELIDRFGDPPKSVLGLIEVSLLRNTAAYLQSVCRLCIEKTLSDAFSDGKRNQAAHTCNQKAFYNV